MLPTFAGLLNSLSENSVSQMGFIYAFLHIAKTEAMYISGCWYFIVRCYLDSQPPSGGTPLVGCLTNCIYPHVHSDEPSGSINASNFLTSWGNVGLSGTLLQGVGWFVHMYAEFHPSSMVLQPLLGLGLPQKMPPFVHTFSSSPPSLYP